MWVYCGQTVGWIKMPLGTQVGLGPGHIVLEWDPALPPRKRHSSPPFRSMSIVAKRLFISATAELLYTKHWESAYKPILPYSSAFAIQASSWQRWYIYSKVVAWTVFDVYFRKIQDSTYTMQITTKSIVSCPKAYRFTQSHKKILRLLASIGNSSAYPNSSVVDYGPVCLSVYVTSMHCV